MPYRLTGAGGFGFSVNWEKVPGDENVARAVITFLEDRRLLYWERPGEIAMYCITSAIEIRQFLTHEISHAKAGKSLAQSLRAMRAAFRVFVDAAGPNGSNFVLEWRYYPQDPFSVALGELRSRVGLQVALIASQYDIEVEDDLARILPPPLDDDPSFVPGFEDKP